MGDAKAKAKSFSTAVRRDLQESGGELNLPPSSRKYRMGPTRVEK